jgi:glycosyltransferase involved in cell wall biosynthesis
MASGCPVITTDEAPMTEVGGKAGFYIPRRPYQKTEVKLWANNAAKVINQVLKLSSEERKILVESGLDNAKRFDSESALNQIETIYQNVVQADKSI